VSVEKETGVAAEPDGGDADDYRPGELVQRSYGVTPGDAPGSLGLLDLWRDGDWRARMNREVDYWHGLLSQYSRWKAGELVPQPYDDKFREMGRGGRMFLDVRLEHCAPFLGRPQAWRVRWIEDVVDRLEGQKAGISAGAAFAAVMIILMPLLVGLPVAAAWLVVGLYWLRKLKVYRARLKAEEEELRLTEAAEAVAAR
jgi:hypothetical protein